MRLNAFLFFKKMTKTIFLIPNKEITKFLNLKYKITYFLIFDKHFSFFKIIFLLFFEFYIQKFDIS
jgi:hypothetical protein